ncbi:MAG: hypothetical protein P1U57_09270 [Oleibacter sp.]|nr:hypothetical protein [Thalassolituus sp.]
MFEGQLTVTEVEDILWYEVYPVLQVNLRSVAGEWSGWSDAWLVENLPPTERPKSIEGKSYIIKDIQACWRRVVEIYEERSF